MPAHSAAPLGPDHSAAPPVPAHYAARPGPLGVQPARPSRPQQSRYSGRRSWKSPTLSARWSAKSNPPLPLQHPPEHRLRTWWDRQNPAGDQELTRYLYLQRLRRGRPPRPLQARPVDLQARPVDLQARPVDLQARPVDLQALVPG